MLLGVVGSLIRCLQSHMGFGEADIQDALRCAFQASFLDQERKDSVLQNTPEWALMAEG